MAQPDPEGWFSPETMSELVRIIKEGAGWMAAGAVLLGVFIKRGWVFIGDRTKLAAKLAIAQTELKHQKMINAQKDKEISELRHRLTSAGVEE